MRVDIRRRHLVISTHFDDAVLSTAHLLQAAGARASIVTVCGGVPAKDTPAESWDRDGGFETGDQAAEARAAEDAAACKLTGAVPHRLDHLDGPYRAADLSAARLRDEVSALWDEDTVLWLPAGMTHGDHIQVRDALLPLAGATPSRAGIYIDLPYAGQGDFSLPAAVAKAVPEFHCEDVYLSGPEFARKVEAVEKHGSQTPLLTREDHWPALLDGDGPLARERYWTLAAVASPLSRILQA